MNRGLLSSSVSADHNPISGVILNDIVRNICEAPSAGPQIEDFLLGALSKEHPGTKLKVLRILTHICESWQPECTRLKQSLARKSAAIRTYLQYTTKADPLVGDAYIKRVRTQAQACLQALFSAPSKPVEEMKASTEGFGSADYSANSYSIEPRPSSGNSNGREMSSDRESKYGGFGNPNFQSSQGSYESSRQSESFGGNMMRRLEPVVGAKGLEAVSNTVSSLGGSLSSLAYRVAGPKYVNAPVVEARKKEADRLNVIQSTRGAYLAPDSAAPTVRAVNSNSRAAPVAPASHSALKVPSSYVQSTSPRSSPEVEALVQTFLSCQSARSVPNATACAKFVSEAASLDPIDLSCAISHTFLSPTESQSAKMRVLFLITTLSKDQSMSNVVAALLGHATDLVEAITSALRVGPVKYADEVLEILSGKSEIRDNDLISDISTDRIVEATDQCLLGDAEERPLSQAARRAAFNEEINLLGECDKPFSSDIVFPAPEADLLKNGDRDQVKEADLLGADISNPKLTSVPTKSSHRNQVDNLLDL